MALPSLPFKTTTSITGVKGTKVDTEYRNLGERLRQTCELAPGNEYGIYTSGTILAACVPKSSLARPSLQSLVSPERARRIVEAWIAREVSGDDVAADLFGIPTFDEMADAIGEREGYEVGSISPLIANQCRNADPQLASRISKDPTAFSNLNALLERLASSALTHSNLHLGPRSMERWSLPRYTAMATAGFSAVSLAIQLDPARIDWPPLKPEPGFDVGGLAAVRLHSEPDALALLPPSYATELARLAAKQSSRLTEEFGDPVGQYQPVAYHVSLMRSATSGATLAAIAADPSACRTRHDVAAAFRPID